MCVFCMSWKGTAKGYTSSIRIGEFVHAQNTYAIHCGAWCVEQGMEFIQLSFEISSFNEGETAIEAPLVLKGDLQPDRFWKS